MLSRPTRGDQWRARTSSYAPWRPSWPRGTAPAGWWADTTVGAVAESGLTALHDQSFVVHSQARPWRGTFGEVDARSRALAGWLAARGVGAGDVVVLQLPNWMEAGVAFFAATYLGAVVVPVVHFYGAKEVDYILRATEPSVVVTPDRFGHTDHLAMYDEFLAAHPDTPAGSSPRTRRRSSRLGRARSTPRSITRPPRTPPRSTPTPRR